MFKRIYFALLLLSFGPIAFGAQSQSSQEYVWRARTVLVNKKFTERVLVPQTVHIRNQTVRVRDRFGERVELRPVLSTVYHYQTREVVRPVQEIQYELVRLMDRVTQVNKPAEIHCELEQIKSDGIRVQPHIPSTQEKLDRDWIPSPLPPLEPIPSQGPGKIRSDNADRAMGRPIKQDPPDDQRTHQLPPGIHDTDWNSFAHAFGFTPKRGELLQGMCDAANVLNRKATAAKFLIIGGSFTTNKRNPGDWDAAVDPGPGQVFNPSVHALFNDRSGDKKRFKGEFFPSRAAGNGSPTEARYGVPRVSFVDFFGGVSVSDDGNRMTRGLVRLNISDVVSKCHASPEAWIH